MDGEADMESCHVLSTRDCRLSAQIATLIPTRRAYAASSAGWRVRRFGYGWRDPHRKRRIGNAALFWSTNNAFV
jgi:hypothetical protein